MRTNLVEGAWASLVRPLILGPVPDLTTDVYGSKADCQILSGFVCFAL